VSLSADVLVIGGGVMGSSAAYHLATDGRAGHVLVVERDPTYARASTALSAGGIRQQFTLPENIRLSQASLAFYRRIGEHLAVDGDAPDIGLTAQGYLFLADAAGAARLRANVAFQVEHGAPVEALAPAALAERFPGLSTTGVAQGAFGREDGWMDPYSVLQAFRRKARSLGVTYRQDEVVALTRAGARVAAARLASGEVVTAETVVVAAGAWTPALLRQVGWQLPVEPVRRMAFHFLCPDRTLASLPLVIDADGLWFRPEGAGFIAGKAIDDEAPGYNFDVDYSYFDEVLWPLLAHRVPAFAELRLQRGWAALYDLNTADANMILGRFAGEIENMIVVTGFSGHGLQHAPAVGRAVAELVLDGRFTTLDLTALGFGRFAGGRLRREENVA